MGRPTICNNCHGYDTDGCYLKEVKDRPVYDSGITISGNTVLERCTATGVSESVRMLRDLSQSLDNLHANTQRLRGMDTLELGVYDSEPRDSTQ